MECDVVPIAQLLNLIAHVSEEQAVLVEVDLQASLEQAQHQAHPTHRYHTLVTHATHRYHTLAPPHINAPVSHHGITITYCHVCKTAKFMALES